MTLFLALLAFLLPQTERPVILALGDSMTAGFGVEAGQAYPAQLEGELARRGYNYRVVNQGVSGSSSTQTMAGLTRGLILSPEIVILQTGGNDRSAGLSREASQANIRRIMARLKPGHARIFFGGGRFPYLDEVAKAEGAEVFPFLQGVEGHPELLISDQHHPNSAGYSVVVQNILKVLEPTLAGKK